MKTKKEQEKVEKEYLTRYHAFITFLDADEVIELDKTLMLLPSTEARMTLLCTMECGFQMGVRFMKNVFSKNP